MRSLILLLCLLLSLPVLSQEREHFSLAQFKLAAKAIHDNPDAPDTKRNAQIIVGFTTESHDVLVDMTPAIIDIFRDRSTPSAILVAAYASGQAQAQLNTHVKDGYRLAGAQEIFWVYAKLQKSHPGYRNEGVEALLEAKKSGTLNSLLNPKPGNK